jgi:hypothetical protein
VSTQQEPVALDEQGPVSLHEQPQAVVDGLRGRAVQPRLVVGLLLIAGGLLWAVFRGLEFYGVGPVDLAYDLDQPPLLLVLVGAWLMYRSRG